MDSDGQKEEPGLKDDSQCLRENEETTNGVETESLNRGSDSGS